MKYTNKLIVIIINIILATFLVPKKPKKAI